MSVYRYLTGIHSSLSDDSKHYNWLFTLLLLSSSLEKNLKIQQFIINTIKDFLEINFSDAHVLAVLYRHYSYFVERGTTHVRPNTIANYIKKKVSKYII